MKPHVLRVLALLAAVGGGACQGDTLLVGGGGPLERQDVEGLPPGSGTGEAASGAFAFAALERRSCRCDGADEAGLCDVTTTATGLTLIQDEGALRAEFLDPFAALVGDITLEGGIDEDGAFVVGGIDELSLSGVRFAQSFNRAEGVVRPNEGGELEWVRRSRSLLGDGSDCTMVFDIELSWWEPDDVGPCNVAQDCHPQRPYCSNFVCTDGSVGTPCSFSVGCASGFCVDDVCTSGAAGAMCTFGSDCLSGSCSNDSCD